MADQFVEPDATVSHDSRHIRTQESIGHEDQGNDNHRPAHRAARSLKNENRADQADDDVLLRVHAGAQDQFLVLNNEIHRGPYAQDGKQHVQRIHLLPGPGFPGRVKQENQAQAKSQVDRTLQVGVQDAKNRRVQLKDGKEDADGGNQDSPKSFGIPRIGFLIVFFQHLVCRHLRRSGSLFCFIRHIEPHILSFYWVPARNAVGNFVEASTTPRTDIVSRPEP